MPIKVKIVDNSSETKVGVGDGAAIHLFKEALKRETKERTEADKHLQEEIDNLTAGSAAYLLITENENGSIDISILNSKEEVLDTKTITLTEKLIRNIDFDYETCQLIFTYFDGTTSTCSLNEIKEALLAEIERAKAAEQELTDNLNQEIQARIAEEARAKEAEAELDEKIETEAARAFAAEQVLDAKIETETERAEGAEANLNARINALDLSEVGSDGSYIKTISQEDGQVSATRQAFDTTLDGADNTKAPTSKTVKDYVDAETSRAEDKEAELEQAISDEESRAEREEEAINTRIDNLDLSEVGAAGSYIKLVSQAEGQVSATAQAFDTDVLNNTETNAPTTKAVKTYVDTYGGKIDTVTIDGDYLPIDENKNVEIPTVRTDINNQELSSTQKTNAKTNLDLENVDNTADLDKPISMATQNALDLKADDNAVVHFAGIETITGEKTFTNSNGITVKNGDNYSRVIIDQNGTVVFKRNDATKISLFADSIRLNGDITPQVSATYDIGASDLKWDNIYLADSIYGDQGRKDIDLSGGGIALGSELYTTLVRPKTDNASDLGTTDFKYKDLYLSGKNYTGTTKTYSENTNYFIDLNNTGTDDYAFYGAAFVGLGGQKSLGTNTNKWKDAYISGNISDGTNSTTVENIVTKTDDQTITATKKLSNKLQFINSSGIGFALKTANDNSGYLDVLNNNDSLMYRFDNNFWSNSSSDLGTSSKKWKDGYFSGTVNADTFIGKIKSSYSNRTLTFGTDDFNINFPNTIFTGKFKTGANDSYGLLVPSTSSLTENKTIAVTTDITNAINALDAASVGEDGYYLKTIVEADGLITATKEQFDRSIDSNASHNNTPSSQAVREFVNSSISTNTANFLGTFTSVSLLPTTGVTNNDYAFVTNSVLPTDYQNFAALDAVNKATLTNYDYGWVINAEDNTKFDLYRFDQENQAWILRVSKTNKEDVALNDAYNRYKYNASTSTWVFEYTLNNSSFTAAQWAAINSTINADKVNRIVYTDTNQEISGQKSFLDGTLRFKQIGGNNRTGYFSVGNQLQIFWNNSRQMVFDGNAIYSGTDFLPYNNTLSLGNSNFKWKDAYITGKVNQNASNFGLLFPDTSDFTEDKTLVTEDRVNELASNKADKVTNATNNDVAGLDSTGNLIDSGIAIDDVVTRSGTQDITGAKTFTSDITLTANIKPSQTGYRSVGTNSARFNEGYINTLNSDNINIGTTNVNLSKDPNDNRLYVKISGSTQLKIGSNETLSANTFSPDSNNTYDLGRAGLMWRDLYVARNLTDGTNETTIAKINNNFAPIYDATSTYAVGDKVIYQGVLYRCTTAIDPAEAWDSTHWTQVSIGGDYVDIASEQTINGVKTFTTELKLANTSNSKKFSIINDSVNNRIEFNYNNTPYLYLNETENAVKTISIIPAGNSGTKDLGSSSQKWKDLYLGGYIYAAQGTAFDLGGAGVAMGMDLYSKTVRPRTDNASDLGTAALRYKDTYITGKHYLGYPSNDYTLSERNWNIYHNQYNELVFSRTYNSVIQDKIKFNGGSIYTEDTVGNLGTTNKKWNDLYLKGALTDGTNSITIAHIEDNQNKVTSDVGISASSTDTEYPSAKAVVDYVDTYGGKIDSISLDGTALTIDQNKNVDIPVSLTITTGSEAITVNSDSLNVVTTDTAQTITGNKTVAYTTRVKFKKNNSNNETTDIHMDAGHLKVSGGDIQVSSTIFPQSNGSVDLGWPNFRFRDLYLSRNLSDGTNSLTIANIQEKVQVQRFI